MAPTAQQPPVRRVLLLLVVLLLLCVSLKAAAFTCEGGSKTLPDAYVLDGYCDCEDCADEGFTCSRSADGLPQRLFPSRVGDRVCDCCDGTCLHTCANALSPRPSVHPAILLTFRAL